VSTMHPWAPRSDSGKHLASSSATTACFWLVAQQQSEVPVFPSRRRALPITPDRRCQAGAFRHFPRPTMPSRLDTAWPVCDSLRATTRREDRGRTTDQRPVHSAPPLFPERGPLRRRAPEAPPAPWPLTLLLILPTLRALIFHTWRTRPPAANATPASANPTPGAPARPSYTHAKPSKKLLETATPPTQKTHRLPEPQEAARTAYQKLTSASAALLCRQCHLLTPPPLAAFLTATAGLATVLAATGRLGSLPSHHRRPGSHPSHHRQRGNHPSHHRPTHQPT
jgi:hypothetical protein